MSKTDLEIQQEKELYEFKHQQRLKKYKQVILNKVKHFNKEIADYKKDYPKDDITKSHRYTRTICDEHAIFNEQDFGKHFVDYLWEQATWCPYIFTFGKYKGQYVSKILQKDENYCQWFIENVRGGNNLNTLQIIDYLLKKLSDYDYIPSSNYFFGDVESMYKNILLETLHEKYHKYLNKKEILKWFKYDNKRRDSWTLEEETNWYTRSFDANYHNDDLKEDQYTREDYGISYADEDFCNDLCYWGDPILGYGDLC